MTVVGLLALHLTSSCRQQMLQGAKTALNPMAPLPCSYQPWPADGGFETHDVELLLPGLTDHEERHRAIGWTGRPQPRIAQPRHLLAIPPRPIAVLLQVVAFHLPPIKQVEDIGTLPFHEECPLVGGGYMGHELGITEPAIRDDHKRWQCHTASVECCHASIEHALHPTELVTTRSARPLRIRATYGKIHGNDQLPIADDDNQEDPINPREHPVFLPAPPGAHDAQCTSILFEHRVITHLRLDLFT